MSSIGFKKNAWRLLPAIVIGAVMWVLWQGLYLDEEPLNKNQQQMPFPEFSLPDIRTQQNISLKDMRGEIQIVHVWASWCGPCVQEHNTWVEIKNRWPISLIGMIYRDDAQKALNVVGKKGDPYTYLLDDHSGRLGVSLGVMGTPETYVVDSEGIIRHHHIGVLSMADFEQEFLPVIEQIHREQAA